MKVKKLPWGSLVYGELPLGCKLCMKGKKAVLFITGICPLNCYYCPISIERKNKDVVFINERRANKFSTREIIEELELMDAEGMSISGGEPLTKLRRALDIIKKVKGHFGKGFHIHLYSSGVLLTYDIIKKLESAGLDELRIHIANDQSLKRLESLESQVKIDLGVENPVIPKKEKEIISLIKRLEKMSNVKFINLNELEFSESNALGLLERGIEQDKDLPMVARGSAVTAEKVIKWVYENELRINIHFCTATYKDRVQTGLRFYNRGINVAGLYEYVNDDGLLIRLRGKNKYFTKFYKKGFLHPELFYMSHETIKEIVYPTDERLLVYSENIS